MSNPSIFSKPPKIVAKSFTSGLFNKSRTVADLLLDVVNKANINQKQQQEISELKAKTEPNSQNELSEVYIDQDLLKKIQIFCKNDPKKIKQVASIAKEKEIFDHPAIQGVIAFLNSENNPAHSEDSPTTQTP